jgi:hypothetical protein
MKKFRDLIEYYFIKRKMIRKRERERENKSKVRNLIKTTHTHTRRFEHRLIHIFKYKVP